MEKLRSQPNNENINQGPESKLEEQITRLGLFIAIEGSDGCGKQTQTKALIERLEADERPTLKLDFPRYDEASSFFVRKYLAGDYGSIDEIDEKTASLFFALDRYDAKAHIHKALETNTIVITDRFVASNLAHQGAKIANDTDRKEFFSWIHHLEFEILKIPEPDLNLILDIPVEISQGLIQDRAKQDQSKLDIHETDETQQTRSRQIYRELCEHFPDKFIYINCLNSDLKLSSAEEIHDLIFQEVKNYL